MGKKTEQGNVVEIVIIVVLLLAVMGLVVWRVVGGNKPANSVPQQTQNSTSQTPTSKDGLTNTDTRDQATDSNKGYFKISEWGVSAKYDTSKTTILYEVSGNAAVLLGSKLVGKQYCKYGYSGSIKRYAPTEHLSAGDMADSGMTAEKFFADHPADSKTYIWKKVGDYYYFWGGPQATCTDDMLQYEQDSTDATKGIVENLQATQ